MALPNLQYLWQVVEQMSDYFRDYKLLVVKSIFPIGTTQKISLFLSETTKCSFDVALIQNFKRRERYSRFFQTRQSNY